MRREGGTRLLHSTVGLMICMHTKDLGFLTAKMVNEISAEDQGTVHKVFKYLRITL